MAQQISRFRGGQPLRVLDIGCGSGYACTLLEQGGLHGQYIGLDLNEHPDFKTRKCAQFARLFIATDILEFDPESIPPVDLLISMTALEHFEDDAGALERARQALADGGAEIHVVPAEDGLRLWETHGWRQYSPAGVRTLCPNSEIYRIGGSGSGFVHFHCITRPARRNVDWRTRHPKLYRSLRTFGYVLDAMTRYNPPALYAAVSIPGLGDNQ